MRRRAGHNNEAGEKGLLYKLGSLELNPPADPRGIDSDRDSQVLPVKQLQLEEDVSLLPAVKFGYYFVVIVTH